MKAKKNKINLEEFWQIYSIRNKKTTDSVLTIQHANKCIFLIFISLWIFMLNFKNVYPWVVDYMAKGDRPLAVVYILFKI